MHLIFLCLLALRAGSTPAPGDTLFAHGRFTEANAAYAKAVAIDSRDVDAHAGLARVALFENRLGEAAREAHAALALDPHNRVAERILHTVAQRRGVLESAQKLDIPAGGIIVPFLAVDPLPLMQFKVNGRIGNFLLDTGGPDVVLDPGFANELGLAVTGGKTGTFAGGRTAQVRQTFISEMSVGPLVLHNLNADVLPSRGLPFFGERKVDGVVGTVFLSRFLATIDYPHRRLVLKPRTGAAPPGTAVPMWLVGDHFIFARGSVNGLRDQLFLVDSGLAGGGFSPEAKTIAAAHLKTFPDKAQTGIGGGGPVKFIPVVADELCLANACQKDIPGMYTPEGSPLAMFPFAVSGAVSHKYLEHYAVTLDFSRMELTLSP